MTDRSDTWMPFYVGDYLAATTRLSTEQHGAYMLLLIDYWRNGPPPDDNAVLTQITKLSPASWRKARKALIGFFEARDGLLIQKRAERERLRAADITEKRRRAGEASAKARANGQQGCQQTGNKRSTHVGTNGQQNGRPLQSHTPLEHKGSNGGDSDKQFWDSAKAYLGPKKASLIGQWVRDHGKEQTASAITAAQLERAVNPVEFIQGRFRKAGTYDPDRITV
jgi:uncharacterized protein YdaU (DUF1376 family)